MPLLPLWPVGVLKGPRRFRLRWDWDMNARMASLLEGFLLSEVIQRRVKRDHDEIVTSFHLTAPVLPPHAALRLGEDPFLEHADQVFLAEVANVEEMHAVFEEASARRGGPRWCFPCRAIFRRGLGPPRWAPRRDSCFVRSCMFWQLGSGARHLVPLPRFAPLEICWPAGLGVVSCLLVRVPGPKLPLYASLACRGTGWVQSARVSLERGHSM